MRQSELIFKTIDKMSIKELKELSQSQNDTIKPYLNYIKLKIDEKKIVKKYLSFAS